ncbi:MAG: hypothetical protein ACM3IH_07335 [Sphingobacteriales bacterium]
MRLAPRTNQPICRNEGIEICRNGTKATEQRTREELNEKWSTFPAADRINCVKSLTFSPTYTELVTCLEIDIKPDVCRTAEAEW